MREFGRNRSWTLLWAGGTIMFGMTAAGLYDLDSRTATKCIAGLMLVFAITSGYLFVRFAISKLVIHEAGISFRTIRGSGQLLWEEIERIRYSVKWTVYHYSFAAVPVKEHVLTLFGAAGEKVELGSNLQSPDEVAKIMWEKLRPLMREKMIADLKSGKTIQLGRLRLSPAGLRLKTYFGKVVFIPWKRLSSCKIDGTGMRFWENVGNKQRVHALMLSSVHNIYPLIDVVRWKFEQREIAAKHKKAELAFGI